MATFKKKELNEIVGGDFTATGSDRNSIANSEIETGPVDKPFNNTSNYEKGQSTTSDTVFGRYRQNIPWFVVYSFGGSGSGRGITANVDTSLDDPFVDKDKTVGSYNIDIPDYTSTKSMNDELPLYATNRTDVENTENIYEENKSVVIKKKTMEERIEDLVKRTKSNDVTDKNYSPKVDKILDTIHDEDLSEKQLEDLKSAIMDRINNPKQVKKL
jgi:hypothetical protein